jgi:hypothetical protein
MGYLKKQREDGMPNKHDPKRKKMDASMSMKKKEKKIHIAMPSSCPNKRRDP